MLTKRNVLPPLDYLVAFEAAAKLGGFARAAEHLHISESAISRKVRLLEDHYRVSLFVRSHRSVTLTENGAALLASVSRALGVLRGASEDLLSRGDGGTVALAATNSVASLWLMPRLSAFHAANEGLRIMLTASDSDVECLSDQMELSILRGEGDWPGFEAELLFGETIFPVCAPDYAERFPSVGSLARLPELDLIEVSSHHPEWMDWKAWLGHQGLHGRTLERSAVFNTYPLAVQAAADGLGIALGWGHLVDRHLKSGALVRPLGDRAVRTRSGYYLLRRKGQTARPAQNVVASWLRRESAARKRYGSAPKGRTV